MVGSPTQTETNILIAPFNTDFRCFTKTTSQLQSMLSVQYIRRSSYFTTTVNSLPNRNLSKTDTYLVPGRFFVILLYNQNWHISNTDNEHCSGGKRFTTPARADT